MHTCGKLELVLARVNALAKRTPGGSCIFTKNPAGLQLNALGGLVDLPGEQVVDDGVRDFIAVGKANWVEGVRNSIRSTL